MDSIEKAIITICDGYVAIKTENEGVLSTKYVSPDTFGKAMASGVNFDVGLLPPNCVAYKKQGFSHVFALYTPSCIRKVRYVERASHKSILLKFEIPFPKLLWIVRLNCINNELNLTTIYAVKDEKITMNTEIFYPTFNNVHSNGNVCWGYGKMEGKIYKNMYGISAIPEVFFSLVFNSDLSARFSSNISNIIGIDPNSYSFFQYLEKENIQVFPNDVLETRNLTFKTIWGGDYDEDFE